MDPSRRAIEEPEADLPFDARDHHADGRLRDAQASGGAPEVQFLGDGDEGSQMAQVDIDTIRI